MCQIWSITRGEGEHAAVVGALENAAGLLGVSLETLLVKPESTEK
jgi:hypothetical protein